MPSKPAGKVGIVTVVSFEVLMRVLHCGFRWKDPSQKKLNAVSDCVLRNKG